MPPTKAFVEQLRITAAQLEPLTKAPIDPYALAWWTNLISLAAFIEAQETSLGERQISYLRNTLFGGMGSLNDLCFSGPQADQINARLDDARRNLFDSFEKFKNGK